MAADLPERSVTLLLQRWRQGAPEARDRLFPLVYDELRRMAGRSMRGERADHTLQPTALVHEAYLRLVDMEVPWQDRVHFLSVAAVAMRRILVDHARRRGAARRGGGQTRITLDVAAGAAPAPDVSDIDAALLRLEEKDPRKARVVELRFFGGLKMAEIAALLEVSTATVERDLRQARAWLQRELA